MHPKRVRTVHTWLSHSLLWLPLLVVLSPGSARAQMGGIDGDPSDPGTGGKSTILGNVYYPNGRRVDRRMRVLLKTFRGGDMATMTDDNGAFAFRRLAGGSYTVVLEAGKEFEPAQEKVDIIASSQRRGISPAQNVTVQIQLHYRTSDSEKKPEVLDPALAEVPKDARDLYLKALEFARAGESKKAITQLEQAISVYPGFALAMNMLGQEYMRLGQLDKAAEEFNTALKIDPEAFAPRLNLGIVLVYRKRLKEAEKELRLAVSKNDTSGTAHYYLGRTLAVLRKFDEAEKELQRALSLAGDQMGTAHRFLGAIYQARGDNPRAVTELETYLRLVPDAPDANQIRELIKGMRSGAAKKYS
jgi:tetratricopeptide (TPR) repeat protein